MLVYAKGTSHPGLRPMLSGNFVLALNRSHHFLFIKQFDIATSAQWFKLDNFTIYSQYFQQCKIIKIESFCLSCLIKFWLFLTKNDDFYLKPKTNSRMVEGWDQGDLSRWCNHMFAWFKVFKRPNLKSPFFLRYSESM